MRKEIDFLDVALKGPLILEDDSDRYISGCIDRSRCLILQRNLNCSQE